MGLGATVLCGDAQKRPWSQDGQGAHCGTGTPSSPCTQESQGEWTDESLRETRPAWGPRSPFLLLGSSNPCFSGLSLQVRPLPCLPASSFLTPRSTGAFASWSHQNQTPQEAASSGTPQIRSCGRELKLRQRYAGLAPSTGSGGRGGSVLLVLLATPGRLGLVDTSPQPLPRLSHGHPSASVPSYLFLIKTHVTVG